MDRQAIIAKMEQAISDQETVYARSLRRVQNAVNDGLITDEEAQDRPGLRKIEGRIAYLRAELERYRGR